MKFKITFEFTHGTKKKERKEYTESYELEQVKKYDLFVAYLNMLGVFSRLSKRWTQQQK